MEDFLWPKGNVRLFEPGSNNDEPQAWFMSAPDLYSMANMYAESSKALVSLARTSRGIASPFILPAVFLFRHHVELALKSLIVQSKTYTDQKPDFRDRHDLLALWDELAPMFAAFDEEDGLDNESDYQAVRSMLVELQKVDPESMAFRYPVGKSVDGVRPRLLDDRFQALDLRNFAEQAERLENFFLGAAEKLHHDIEIKNDFESWYESETEGY